MYRRAGKWIRQHAQRYLKSKPKKRQVRMNHEQITEQAKQKDNKGYSEFKSYRCNKCLESFNTKSNYCPYCGEDWVDKETVASKYENPLGMESTKEDEEKAKVKHWFGAPVFNGFTWGKK